MQPGNLSGFDMLVAISENTINYQFQQLHRHDHLPREWDLTAADTGISIKARLDPATVSLSVKGQARKVIFITHLKSGTFTYYDGFGRNAVEKEIQIKDWQYAFEVNLDMQAIKLAAIKDRAERGGVFIPNVVYDHLEEFTDDMFKIQHLYMDFQDSNIASYDTAHTVMKGNDGKNLTPGQMAQFGSGLTAYFKSLEGSNHPYILGYSVESKDAKKGDGNATFKPSSCTFSTFEHPQDNGLNALNFLVMTDNHSLPTDQAAGIGMGGYLSSNEDDGKFVIAGNRFFKDWLSGIIEDSLRVSSPLTRLSGQAADAISAYMNVAHPAMNASGNCIKDFYQIGPYEWSKIHEDAVGMIDITESSHEDGLAAVMIRNEGSEKIKVTVYGIWNYNPKASWNPTAAPSGHIGIKSRVTWTNEFEVVCGNDGQIAIANQVNTMGEHSIERDTDGLSSVILAVEDLIPFIKTPGEHLDEMGEKINDRMEDAVKSRGIIPNTLQNRFILPAGDVFFFENLQLNSKGDATMDITYKSTH